MSASDCQEIAKRNIMRILSAFHKLNFSQQKNHSLFCKRESHSNPPSWGGNENGSPSLILPRGEEFKNDSLAKLGLTFEIPICTKLQCERYQIALQKSPNRNAIWALWEDERIRFGKLICWDVNLQYEVHTIANRGSLNCKTRFNQSQIEVHVIVGALIY